MPGQHKSNIFRNPAGLVGTHIHHLDPVGEAKKNGMPRKTGLITVC